MVKIPNFIIAGFPKCGTTSLFAYLERHPEIFIPPRKEMNFFTNPIISKLVGADGDALVNKFQVSSWEEYVSYYKPVTTQVAIGDVSPSYINFPSCYKTIYDKLNDPKVIIIVRDPIKRAFSNYLHLYKKGREKLDFHQAIQEEETRVQLKYSPFWYYKKHSLYYEKIVEAKKIFSNVLVLTQEELKKDSKIVVEKIFEFLEVDNKFIPDNLNSEYNVGGVYKINFVTSIFIKESRFRNFLLEKLPVLKKLKPYKSKILKTFQVPTPKIDADSETFLVNYFKEDVKKVKQLGIDVSSWNKKYFD